MDEAHSTQVRGGGESGYVAHHSAADGDDGGAAIGTGQDQLAGEGLDGLEVFRGFGIVEQNYLQWFVLGQGTHHAAAAVAPNGRRSEDEDGGHILKAGEERASTTQGASGAINVVGARGG